MADYAKTQVLEKISEIIVNENRSLSSTQIANEYEKLLNCKLDVETFKFSNLDAFLTNYKDYFRVVDFHDDKVFYALSEKRIKAVESQKAKAKQDKIDSLKKAEDEKENKKESPVLSPTDTQNVVLGVNKQQKFTSESMFAYEEFCKNSVEGIPEGRMTWKNGTTDAVNSKEEKFPQKRTSLGGGDIKPDRMEIVLQSWNCFKSTELSSSSVDKNVSSDFNRESTKASIDEEEWDLNHSKINEIVKNPIYNEPIPEAVVKSTVVSSSSPSNNTVPINKSWDNSPADSIVTPQLDTGMSKLKIDPQPTTSQTSTRSSRKPHNPTDIYVVKKSSPFVKNDTQSSSADGSKSSPVYSQGAKSPTPTTSNQNSSISEEHYAQKNIAPPQSSFSSENMSSSSSKGLDLRKMFLNIMAESSKGDSSQNSSTSKYTPSPPRVYTAEQIFGNSRVARASPTHDNFSTPRPFTPKIETKLSNSSSSSPSSELDSIETIRARCQLIIGAFPHGISENEFSEQYNSFFKKTLDPQNYGSSSISEMAQTYMSQFIEVKAEVNGTPMLYNKSGNQKQNNNYKNTKRRS